MSRALVAVARTLVVAAVIAVLPSPSVAQQAPPPPAPVPASAPVPAQGPAPAPPPVPAPQPPPPPPPPLWSGAIGAGFAFTSGNADTSTLNIAIDLSSRPKARNVFKAEAIYLRGDEDGDLNVNRLSIKARDEYTRAPHMFLFEQVEYLRDTFKDIDYLIAPTIGLGYKVWDTPERKIFAFDVGIGAKAERNMGRRVRTGGAVTAAQRLLRKLSDHATVTESIAALWTADDFGDALYTLKLGIAASITARSQLKVELADFYKTRPPDDTVQKNDVSVVTSVVYKF